MSSDAITILFAGGRPSNHAAAVSPIFFDVGPESQPPGQRFGHAAFRSVSLVLLG